MCVGFIIVILNDWDVYCALKYVEDKKCLSTICVKGYTLFMQRSIKRRMDGPPDCRQRCDLSPSLL